jgi:hypothetical protein
VIPRADGDVMAIMNLLVQRAARHIQTYIKPGHRTEILVCLIFTQTQ